jgi:uncharacterized membrane-anchored protein YhcB (DUF1043 family)
MKKTKGYKSIFYRSRDEYLYISGIIYLVSKKQNGTLKTIIDSINNYLEKNKGAVSDYHLMKDIVERNTNTAEEEIQTQVPVPIFLGLMGTMVGIIMGVLILIFSGGLDALFNLNGTNDTNSGLEGVKALLGGVGVAMITGIVGILFNTISTRNFRNAKIEVEKNKNTFLSWMQAELLPNLSNNTSSALVNMTRQLSDFNQAFADNTQEFQNTLDKINTSYTLQAGMIDKINRLNINEIATANVVVYEKLKNCTDEIGKLGIYLTGINQYQANTTDTIEKMQHFFSSGIVHIDSINGKVREALEGFGKNTEVYVKDLQIQLDGQVGHIEEVLQQQQNMLLKHFETISTQMQNTASEQQEIFKQKMKETTMLVEELKNLSAIKVGISNFENATNEQNRKIDRLTDAIKELVQVKTSDGIIQSPFKVVKWVKISAIVGGSIIVVFCLYSLIVSLVSLF